MNKYFLVYLVCCALPFNTEGAISYILLNKWFQASQSGDEAQPNSAKHRFVTSFTRAQRVQVLSEMLGKRKDQNIVSQAQLQRLVNLFTDISLFTNDGKKTDHNIMSHIDRTTSAAGALALHKMASTLLAADDPELFAKRQAFIQKLTRDKRLFDKIHTICQTWAAHEDNFIENWSKEDEYHKNSFDAHYYYGKLPYINVEVPFLKNLNHETTLNAGVQCFYNTIISPLMLNTITTSGLKYATYRMQKLSSLDNEKYNNNPFVWKRAIKDSFYTAIYTLNPFRDISYIYNTITGSQKLQEICLLGMDIVKEPNYELATAKAAEIIFRLFSYYLTYRDVRSYCEGVQYAHEKNIGLSAAIECATSLQQLVQEYPMLHNAFASSHELQLLLKEAGHDSNLAQLVALLKRNGTQDISMLRDSGHVLMAHKLIDEHKEAFEGITEIIGEVDACLSLAKLYKEYEDQRVKYCFVQISDQEKPQFKLKEMWHPLLNPETAVTNNFAMGGDYKQHGIITGSNTAGKSTVGLKSPLISLYLAHSLGIAPATKCKTSRFNSFGSYLHVVDDTAAGESAFQAEINRVKDIVDTVEQLPENKHAFIVLDELFRGTAPEASEQGTYKVAQYFAKKSNVISLLATHIKKITNLAHITKDHVNLVIDAEIAKDGSIQRNFKIQEGVSNTNIAMKLFEKDLGDIFKKERDELGL